MMQSRCVIILFTLLFTTAFPLTSFALDPCDVDGDGHSSLICGGDDCDDNDANRYPGNVEVCDGDFHDEDCDSATFGLRDMDADGYVDDSCCNITTDGTPNCGNDCDDNRASTNRLAIDVCDGRDNNCDGAIDDETTVEQFTDWDIDGHGSLAGGSFQVCPDTAGFSPLSNDCDDTNPAIRPGDMVCDTGDAVKVHTCGSDGTWTTASCETDSRCVAQLNGTGVCVPDKPKKPKA